MVFKRMLIFRETIVRQNADHWNRKKVAFELEPWTASMLCMTVLVFVRLMERQLIIFNCACGSNRLDKVADEYSLVLAPIESQNTA